MYKDVGKVVYIGATMCRRVSKLYYRFEKRYLIVDILKVRAWYFDIGGPIKKVVYFYTKMIIPCRMFRREKYKKKKGTTFFRVFFQIKIIF